ncbi:DNA-3-methyladenine glycosylase I [Rummeliibacillus sp. JY-2-4R]
MNNLIRCKWCNNNPLLIQYHDHEWGQMLKSNTALFEALTLEVFQAGLKWETVFNKRENFRNAFSNFKIEEVATFTDQDVERLMNDDGIIRNRRKVEATVHNAKVCLQLIDLHGSLFEFFSNLPELKEEKIKIIKKTFKHVGGMIAESFFMAVGFLPTIHEEACFLYVSNE